MVVVVGDVGVKLSSFKSSNSASCFENEEFALLVPKNADDIDNECDSILANSLRLVDLVACKRVFVVDKKSLFES